MSATPRALIGAEHVGDVEWFNAPQPDHDHECWDQSRYPAFQVARRACGATRRFDWDGWIGKNESSYGGVA